MLKKFPIKQDNCIIKNQLKLLHSSIQVEDAIICNSDSNKHMTIFKNSWLSASKHNSLPLEYINFISIVDNLNYNVLMFYSFNRDEINNIYEANKQSQENVNLKEYLQLGEDHNFWYCISFITKKYYCLCKPSGTVSTEYIDFNDLITTDLDRVL